jgi:DNA-binding MarR family transcriptional regulator
MTEDLLRQLAHMTLGSRLKRLGDRLQADVQRLAKAEGITVPAALFPTLAALDRHGGLTVSGLAQRLGVAQPGVTRNLAQLEAMGLVASVTPVRDQRMRVVSLTRKGTTLVARMKRGLWRRVDAAVTELCKLPEGPLLKQLDAIEEALDGMSLDRRARDDNRG